MHGFRTRSSGQSDKQTSSANTALRSTTWILNWNKKGHLKLNFTYGFYRNAPSSRGSQRRSGVWWCYCTGSWTHSPTIGPHAARCRKWDSRRYAWRLVLRPVVTPRHYKPSVGYQANGQWFETDWCCFSRESCEFLLYTWYAGWQPIVLLASQHTDRETCCNINSWQSSVMFLCFYKQNSHFLMWLTERLLYARHTESTLV
jgi:hypothetical protein